jgi:hypothetical protein
VTMLLAIFFCAPAVSASRVRVARPIAIVAAVVVFPYSDYFRVQAASRGGLTFAPIGETLATKDYDQLTMSANGLWWVANTGYKLGYQLLGDLLFWVPRSIWPDKPLDTGVAIARAFNASNANLSSPLPLEVWVDFGWVGAIVALALLGHASARWDRTFDIRRSRSRHEVLASELLIPVLAGYTFIVMRGPLLQSMSRLTVILLTCAVLVSRASSAGGSAGPAGPSQRGRIGVHAPAVDSLVIEHGEK